MSRYRTTFAIVGFTVLLVGGSICLASLASPSNQGAPTTSPADVVQKATSSLLQVVSELTFPTAQATPVINWEPRQIDLTIPRGGTADVTTTIAVADALSGAVLRVVPELSPYVRVVPTTLQSLKPGETAQVALYFTVPFGASPGLHTGTLQLRASSPSGRSFPLPLPISLRIDAPSQLLLAGNGHSVSLIGPPGWFLVNDSSSSASMYSPQSAGKIDAGSVLTRSDISLGIVPNAIDPEEFIESSADGWYTGYRNRAQRVISGLPAIVIDNYGTTIPRSPIATAFIFLADSVVVINGYTVASNDFELVLAGLRIQ